MTLHQFQKEFGTEEACRDHLYKKRWPKGYVCPKCGHNEHFNITSRHLYQCKVCHFQTSVTAGTIMDKTRTPLTKWFLAMYLMSEDKRGCSALALQQKLGIAYLTAWTISHKIRFAMQERNQLYVLDGTVEMDESFFGATREGSKRGRGTEKTAVLVAVSLTDDGKPKFAQMKVVKSVDSETVSDFAASSIRKGARIRTDGLNVYNALGGEGYNLIKTPYDPKNKPEHLHWLHIIISNVKAFVLGTYHGLDEIHLQKYLDEFCYRFNRRNMAFNLFSHITNACANSRKFPYYVLVE